MGSALNRIPVLALAALAFLLAATILGEYRDARHRQAVSDITTLPLPAPEAPVRGPAPAAGVSAAALEGWSRTILERPLFSPSRRPGRAAVASTAVPRLAGIIIGPGGGRAIFASADGSRAIVAGAGARVGPYLIGLVGPAGVAVTGPTGPELLHPVYDRNATRGNAGMPGATPSILDLLRGHMQGTDGLRSATLPSSILQRAPDARR